jgi:hypothetical protein
MLHIIYSLKALSILSPLTLALSLREREKEDLLLIASGIEIEFS